MPVDISRALAAAPRTTEISWTPEDVQLYHLGIGAGVPATDPRELRYTLESRLHVLPSFATVALVDCATSTACAATDAALLALAAISRIEADISSVPVATVCTFRVTCSAAADTSSDCDADS